MPHRFLESKMLVILACADHETYLTQLYYLLMTLLVHFEAPPLPHPQEKISHIGLRTLRIQCARVTLEHSEQV